ncbi:MAG: hypothetical protein NC401_09495, partial [Ruminococcus sp.]|nr:hypothetical protein [Ruminococcus sp.]
ESYETVEKLLGDFFERNTAGDKEGMKAVIDDIQQKLKSGAVDSAPFKDYFNSMYAGRGAINVNGIAKDYPRESIIRELLQNVFGCDYESPDIKVMIEFLDEGQVKLTYNETGFTLAQVFYYLSVGRNDGDKKREGRFGLGAKSVFANVDWFKMRSNDYSLRVVNDDGTLKVRELELNGAHFNHTEIVFALPEDEQETLHENLTTLTSKKGVYINMVDLCFAFIRKKNLTAADEEECVQRTFNIAIINYGKPEVVYKIQLHRKDENDIPKVRFFENGKSVADFLHAERDGFTYLIPYAISGAKRDAAKVLMSKYNYFSTYELTGFVRANSVDFVDEQLSAFFVSVPNKYITNNRSGIKYDSLEECSGKIEQGILSVAEDYKKLFVLELAARTDAPDRYTLRPKQYVFEFFYNYVNNSGIVKGLREKFGDSISVLFPHSSEPVLFETLRKNGFFTERDDVSKEEHEDGSAVKMLEQDIEQMNDWYGRDDNHVLVAKYDWSVAGTDEGGKEYLYKFYQDGNQYFIESDGGHKVKDYELSAGFRSIISLKLNESIVNGSVADEDALANAFAVIDEMFGENYRISMKYFQFVITSGTATVQFEISKINIGNLKKAYDTLAAHEMRFENHQIFNQVITLMVNSFTNGKDTIQFLQEIKSQGGEVTLALDINKRYRFSVYGKQFMIPPNITNAELLDIVGDVYALIESGLLNNRVFDFPYSAGRFNFDTQDVLSVLPDARNADAVENIMSKTYVCDLGMDKIALLDKDNKLKKIVEMTAPIDAEDMTNSAKLVILRDGMSKPQYAGYAEFLLTGANKNRLSALYSGTEEPNVLLLDQLPYYYKPVPSISRKEFDYLRGQVLRIAPYEKSNAKAYRNYFARDINAKLYGYGGVCPCCGYETGVLNSFVVKKFTIGLMNGEKEQKFNFSLYLCRNDAAAASGWLIDDVSVGGMTPFLWLEEIAEIDNIPPEFLYCRVKFRRQVTYDIVEPGGDANIPETVYDGAPEVLDFVLSPMMAAKWFEDNASPAVREAAVKEAAAAHAEAAAEAEEAPEAVIEAPAEEAADDGDFSVKPTEERGRMRVGADKNAMSSPKLTPRHPKPEDIGNVQM